MQWPAFFMACLKEWPCRRVTTLSFCRWFWFLIIHSLDFSSVSFKAFLSLLWTLFGAQSLDFLSIPQACPEVLCPCPHSELTVPLQPGAMTFSYFMSSRKLKSTYPTCFSRAIFWNKYSHRNSWLLFQIYLLFSTSVKDIGVGLVTQARTFSDPGSPFLLPSLSGMWLLPRVWHDHIMEWSTCGLYVYSRYIGRW